MEDFVIGVFFIVITTTPPVHGNETNWVYSTFLNLVTTEIRKKYSHQPDREWYIYIYIYI